MRVIALLTLLATACAHGGRPRPDEKVLHLRVLVGLEPGAEDGRRLPLEAELRQLDGEPAELRIARLLESGEREILSRVGGAEAEALVREVDAGRGLREVLDRSRLSTLLPSGALELPDPAPCPFTHEAIESRWDAAAGSSRLDGWSLALERRDHPRYGSAMSAVLRDERRDGGRIAVRFGPTDVRLAWLSDDLAVFATCSDEGPFRVSDRRLVDLRSQASILLAERASDALDRGSIEEAAASIDRALALGAEPAELSFQQARLLSRIGGDLEDVLAALAKAIAWEPAVYRMEARLSPDFDPFRGDEAFVELTRPRPLAGSNRAGTPPAPRPEPSTTPEEEPETEPAEPEPLEIPPEG